MKNLFPLIVVTLVASVLSFSQTPQATPITDETLRLCIADVQTRQFEIAITDCGKAIAKLPNMPEGYQARAIAHTNLKNTDAAIADFSKAVQLAPNNPDFLGGRGEIYVFTEKYDLALADFNKILQMFPGNPLALYRRSSVYVKTGKNDLAVADLKTILAANPNNAEVKAALAQLEARMKPFKFEGSELLTAADFLRGADFLREAETIRLRSGRYADFGFDQRNRDKVYDLFSNCVYRFPDDYDCSKKLLEYYDVETGTNAIVLTGENADGTPRVKFEGSRQAKWIEANFIPLYTAVLKKDTKDRWGYYKRGERYLAIKNYPAAVADFTKTIELAPKYSLNYTNRAKAYLGLKKYNEAIADSIKAVEVEDTVVKIYRQYELIDVYIAAAKYDVAISESDQLLAKDPKNATARLKRGLALRAQGKNDLAIADFTAAVKASPSYEQAYRERAGTYRAIGKIDLAIADERQADMLKTGK